MDKLHMKIFFLLCLSASMSCMQAQQVENKICINQLGYYPYAEKIAVVVSDTAAATFSVISTIKKDTVYRGRLGEVKQSTNSSLRTRIADFSAFTGTGEYRLFVPGIGISYPFRIVASVNHAAAVSVLK